MVNYGVAFKLPFTNMQRFAVLFLIAALASLAKTTYQIIQKIADGNAAPGSVHPPIVLSAWLATFILEIIFSTILVGYSIRIAANAVRGKNEMPSFDNVPELAGKGLQYLAASLIYSSPLIAFLLGLTLAIAAKSLGLLLAVAVFGGFLMLIWAFFMIYSMPMLMTHFAHEGRFAAFFEITKILRISFNSTYFVAWLAAIGYSIGIAIPYAIISVMVGLLVRFTTPYALVIIVPFAALYTVILTPAVTNIYGQAYRDITAGKHAATTPAPAAPKRAGRKK